MNILLIDNYDSFTYNLYQVLGELLTDHAQTFSLDVIRNDQLTLNQIKKARYSHIIISPGPGDPSDSAYFGICADVLLNITNTPILGVCLGMQGIAHYFGGKVIKAPIPMHGKTSLIKHDNQGIFKNIPQHIQVMRYHSLIADPESLPKCLRISAATQTNKRHPELVSGSSSIEMTPDSEIMGLRHKTLPIQGIQFHPESFATPAGKQILSNFIYNKIKP